MTELRDISIEKDYTTMSLSSVLYTSGETKVLITTSVSDFLPRWLVGENYGWVTAEYSMLPRATLTRTTRERGTSSGRSHEISRLVGRSLRAVVDFSELGERTLTVDCDVIQADAGTRTAAITGAWVALRLACSRLLNQGQLIQDPINAQVAAVSVGLKNGTPLLDLDYSEDSRADVDLNVVMAANDSLLELQGTAERAPFNRTQLNKMLDLAEGGLQQLHASQRAHL